MFSNTTRMTGMSGLDTEGMIRSLMNAESIKYNNLLRKATLTTYKQESYRNVASSLSTFQKQFFSLTGNISSSMRLNANFKTMSASAKVSGSDKTTADITLRTDASAKAGTHKLTVQQIAQKDRYTGETQLPALTGDKKVNLEELKDGFSFSVSLDGAGGKTISFSKEEMEKFTDTTEPVYETEVGVDGNPVQVLDGDGNPIQVLDGDGKPVTSVSETAESKFASALNDKLAKAFGTDSVVNNNQKVTASVDADGKLSLSVLAGHSAQINGDAAALTSLGSFENGKKTGVNLSRTLGEMFGDDIPEFEINGVDFNKFTAETTLDEVMEAINKSDAGVTLKFDENKSAFVLESNGTGAVNSINFEDKGADGFFKSLLGSSASFDPEADEPNNDPRTSKAQDAIITFNGVTTSRETNSFKIEGISITLGNDSVNNSYDGNGNVTDTTPKDFTITVSPDITDTKKMIMNFVDEYNKLIDSLNKQYYTPRPKSSTGDYFEPLTDDERKEMSESQLKNWDEQAKSGLLNRDPILQKLLSDMRSQITKAVDLGGGKSISLSSIGITTSGSIADAGKLEIDEARLTKALEERGDDVAALFTKSPTDKSTPAKKLATEGIAERLNDLINATIDYKGTIYNKAGIEGMNDKTNAMHKDLTEQNDKISKMLESLRKKEDHYYSMFAKIESAMMKADEQLASLQSILGA